MRLLLDTSILVRVRDADDPRHLTCVQAIQRLRNAGHELCICAQVMIEFWVVATRPREVNGLDLSPADAEADLQDFARLYTLLPEPADMSARWQALVSRYSVRGRQAHDTRLVALMLAHGLTHVLTLNPTDFARYTEVTCLTPDQVP